MALVWVDGFGTYGTSTGSNPSPSGVIGRKYQAQYQHSITVETGRFGNSLRIGTEANCFMQTPVVTTNATMIIGFAFKCSIIAGMPIVSLYDNATQGINLYLTAAGEIQVRRGATVLGTTSGAGLTELTWYWIELKVVCNNTTGSYELRVGETNLLSASSVDTKEGTNNYHDRARFQGNTTGWIQFDDFYVCDASGSVNNDFLGNCRVHAIYPSGDDTANWGTAQPGGSHYANVDEQQLDDDTSYIEESTSGTKDLFTYGDVSNLGTIHGVQINTECRETDAQTFALKTLVKSDTTEDEDAGQNIGTTNYKTMHRIVEQDPDTSAAWTPNGVNAAKFGVKVG